MIAATPPVPVTLGAPATTAAPDALPTTVRASAPRGPSQREERQVQLPRVLASSASSQAMRGPAWADAMQRQFGTNARLPVHLRQPALARPTRPSGTAHESPVRTTAPPARQQAESLVHSTRQRQITSQLCGCEGCTAAADDRSHVRFVLHALAVFAIIAAAYLIAQ
jgi:hypothetical protein